MLAYTASDAVLDFTGIEYTLSGGYFEVNYDPQNGHPNGGETNLVEAGKVEGPRLSADLPPFIGYPTNGCGYGNGVCRYWVF